MQGEILPVKLLSYVVYAAEGINSDVDLLWIRTASWRGR